jgi:hypothetical protein
MLVRTEKYWLEAREYIEESPPEVTISPSLMKVKSYELKDTEFIIDSTEVIITGSSHQIEFLKM